MGERPAELASCFVFDIVMAESTGLAYFQIFLRRIEFCQGAMDPGWATDKLAEPCS